MTVPDLFTLICQHQMSGTLVIANSLEERSFCFSKGEICSATINEAGQQLGQLVESDLKVAATDFANLIQQHPSSNSIGQALVDGDLVHLEDIQALLKRLVRRALREILNWKNWGFHFQEIREPEPTILQMHTQSLVFELAREQDEWNHLTEILPDLDATLHRTPGSVRGHRPKGWDDRLPSQGKLLLEFDGTRDLRQVLTESPYPVLAFAKALVQMLENGMLELELPERREERRCYSHRVPMTVLPNLNSRVMMLLSKQEYQRNEQIELILSSPVLTARALRLIASDKPSKSLPRPLQHELGCLTREAMESILIGEAIRCQLLYPSQFTWYQLWESSLCASLAAKRIAELIGYVDPEMARISALLQDIGAMVLASQNDTSYRDLCSKALKDEEELLRLEQELFHVDHCRAGAQLAEQWGFPTNLKAVIREHHSNLPHKGNRLLAIIRLANALSTYNCRSGNLTLKQITKQFAKPLALSQSDLNSTIQYLEECHEHLEVVGVLT